MIKEKTVFVLGAGASMPYGFPSGAELRERICEQAISGSGGLAQTLFKELGIGKTDLQNFGNAFHRSMQSSIDAFLAKREDLWEIGKYCIAYELCWRESLDAVLALKNDDHWFLELWKEMAGDLNGYQFLRHNKVRFVTFNYDRSLEAMLHEATKHSFGLNDDAAFQTWSPIPVTHVYGALGPYRLPPDALTRPFEPDTSGPSLRKAASGIRVIPEARHDDTEFRMVRTWFEWADRICFLGFGFDALNMDRLGIDSVLEYMAEGRKAIKRPRIVASTYGMTDKEVQLRLNQKIQYADFVTFNEKNLMTLRKSGILG